MINTSDNNRYDRKTGVLTIGDLKAGETFTFQMITVVNATGTIVNNADVSSHEFDTNMNNNHAEKNIFVYPASDLAVVKSVSDASPNYRDYVTWTIEISNNGPDTAHDVVMYDQLPKSLIYVDCDRDYSPSSGIWNVGTLEKGEKVTLKIRCIVNATGLIENFVCVNATEFDYDESNNNDSERVFVEPASDLAIVKVVNASNVNYNDFVKWTLTVTNRGPDIAKNVRVADFLPDGFEYVDSIMSKGECIDDIFSIGLMEVGETVTVEIITFVDSTGNFTNYANVTSINNGPDVAHNVTISDLLPDSLIWIGDDSAMKYDPLAGVLIIDELGIGKSFTLNMDCRVNATGLIENNVSVNASEYDYDLDNNFDNETIDVEPAADVSVIKLVNNSSPYYNDLVKWTLVISNNGPDKATDVYVEDRLPDGMILVSYNATKGFYDNGIWAMCCLNR